MLTLLPSIGSVLLGLPYMLGMFGPTEREAAQWGLVSLLLGMGLATVWIAHVSRGNVLTAWALNAGYLRIALLQVLPILLWWQFHGYGISDGTPPSHFEAHWLFSIPHLLLLLLSLVSIGLIIGKQRKQNAINCIGQPGGGITQSRKAERETWRS